MSKTDTGVIAVAQGYGEIKKLQAYLPKIKDIIVNADVDQIKAANFIKNLLSVKSEQEYFNWFDKIDAFTKNLIGFAGGYMYTFRIDKLTQIIKNMARAQESQKGGNFNQTAKQYEQLVLEMDAEKRDLQRTINKLLELQKSILNDAASKARLTAVDSKKRYRNASETIKTLLGRIYNDETDEYGKVDVDKLTRVYWGKKESYFKG